MKEENRFVNTEIIKKGRLFKAYDEENQCYVGIKCWRREDEYGKKEINTLMALSLIPEIKGYIPEYIQSFEEGGDVYLVESWLDGITLEEYICAKGGKLQQREACMIISGLCKILSFLHKSVIPLVFVDLKPENILVNIKGDDIEVGLVDFESCCSLAQGEGDVYRKTALLGSAFYTAPEVTYGRPCIRSDIYSLGAILSYCLRGTIGFPGSDVPEGMRWIICVCMQTDPEIRYRSTESLLEALQGMAEEEIGETEVNYEDRRISRIDEKMLGKDKVKILSLGRMNCYKKIIVMTDGNLCFATELAYSAARSFGMTVGLFTLSEQGNGRIRYYLDFYKKYSSLIREDSPFDRLYSVSEYTKNLGEWVKEGRLSVCKNIDSLYIGNGTAFKEIKTDKNGESFISASKMFANWAYASFDLTVISAEQGDDREIFSMLARECDYVIATPYSNIDCLENTRDYFERMASEGVFHPGNIRYVAWDYQDKLSIPQQGISKIIGEDGFLGVVSYLPERLSFRNRKGRVFCESGFENFESEYENILTNLMQ